MDRRVGSDLRNGMQRRILGILAIVFVLVAVATWLWRPDAEVVLACCWRGGALFAAGWLAYPDIQRLPNWLLLTLPAALVVLIRWPRLLLPVIPLLIVVAALRAVWRSKRSNGAAAVKFARSSTHNGRRRSSRDLHFTNSVFASPTVKLSASKNTLCAASPTGCSGCVEYLTLARPLHAPSRRLTIL